jgi:hypothetical protein
MVIGEGHLVHDILGDKFFRYRNSLSMLFSVNIIFLEQLLDNSGTLYNMVEFETKNFNSNKDDTNNSTFP